MKQFRIHIPLTAALILIAAGITTIATRSSRGQTPSGPQKTESTKTESPKTESPKTESLVKPTVMTPKPFAPSAPFAEASAQNGQLRNELVWTFGSKQQHGWYL